MYIYYLELRSLYFMKSHLTETYFYVNVLKELLSHINETSKYCDGDPAAPCSTAAALMTLQRGTHQTSHIRKRTFINKNIFLWSSFTYHVQDQASANQRMIQYIIPIKIEFNWRKWWATSKSSYLSYKYKAGGLQYRSGMAMLGGNGRHGVRWSYARWSRKSRDISWIVL